MSNCSDIGFQGSSPRDARFVQFMAQGPGIAGFKFEVDPETDGDAAAQFLAGADMARVEEMDLRLNRANDWAACDSLEALKGLGVEFADPESEEAIMAFEDAEEIADLPRHLVAQFGDEGEESEGDDGEGAIAALDPKYLKPRQERTISTYRSAEANEIANAGRRRGAPRFGIAARCRGLVEVARFVERHIAKAEADRKTAEAKAAAAKPESHKGNGNQPKAAPPVGKFLAGVVVDQGPKGLLVDIGHGLEARVRIADEYGHGSWDAAAAWLHSHKVGTKVRIRLIRANGHMEAVLSDRHPRPFWKKEVNQQATEEARPAN